MGDERCVNVAVSGVANAGKSTLINNLVGSEISIVTQKVKTTTHKVCGVVIRGDVQIALYDTPGFLHGFVSAGEKDMLGQIRAAASIADYVALVVDVRYCSDAKLNRIVSWFRKRRSKILLILNKIDLVTARSLTLVVSCFRRSGLFEKVFCISALSGEGVSDLVGYLCRNSTKSSWKYPASMITDTTDEFFLSEITRKHVLTSLNYEVPYLVVVHTDSIEVVENESRVLVHQTIYVSKDSHKVIVLGARGQKLKSIGVKARYEMRKHLDSRVGLFIFVKVRKDIIRFPARYLNNVIAS